MHQELLSGESTRMHQVGLTDDLVAQIGNVNGDHDDG